MFVLIFVKISGLNLLYNKNIFVSHLKVSNTIDFIPNIFYEIKINFIWQFVFLNNKLIISIVIILT